MLKIVLCLAVLAVACHSANADCLEALGGKANVEGKKVIDDVDRLTKDIVKYDHATEILQSSIPKPNRVIRGFGMTMDYRQNRITLILDHDGIVTSASCN